MSLISVLYLSAGLHFYYGVHKTDMTLSSVHRIMLTTGLATDQNANAPLFLRVGKFMFNWIITNA